mmetsp:Transcript_4045/g.9975  ORF Transcript_4045/g.9975 Transcript_4045/m.9975 type:complete len:91 (+) Transcript_4045:705-977(+)
MALLVSIWTASTTTTMLVAEGMESTMTISSILYIDNDMNYDNLGVDTLRLAWVVDTDVDMMASLLVLVLMMEQRTPMLLMARRRRPEGGA